MFKKIYMSVVLQQRYCLPPPSKKEKIQNTLLRPLLVALKKDGKFLEIQSWIKYLEQDKKNLVKLDGTRKV